MSTNLLPYADENFDADDCPNEVPPGRDTSRFPLTRPKANVAGITRNGKKFAERVAEAANTGRDTADHVTPDDVPEGLIRAFEAIDADPDSNLSRVTSGSISTVSTGDGELLVLEVLVNPIAVVPDPMNGRTADKHVNLRSRFIDPTDHNHALDIPIYDIGAASDLIDAANRSHTELGFRNDRIKVGKNRDDLVSIGLQGVHEPILLMPHMYRDSDGNTMHCFVAHDGNRRLAMSLRVQRDVAGFDQAQLTSWTVPMRGGDAPALKDWDAAAVNVVRERSAINPQSAGSWFPESGCDTHIDEFLKRRVDPHVTVRSFLRTRALKAQIVIGVNNSTLSATARNSVSPSTAVMKQRVNRLHIKEAGTLEWSENAQATQVATTVLQQVRDGIRNDKDFVPLTEDEVAAVLDNTVKPWDAADDLNLHPMRLAAKVAATVICSNHDCSSTVKDVMKSFSISTGNTKIADNKARIAAYRVVPLLGYSNDSYATRQVRAAIDAFCKNRYFRGDDNGGRALPWWTLLDLDGDELAAAAKGEVALNSDAKPHEAGPACRALSFKALFCLCASPAVQPTAAKSPFAVTGTGTGRTNAVTAVKIEQLVFKLFELDMGIDQLAEVVRCGETIPVTTPPKNLINPEAQDEGDPSTRGWLTEEFLRGPELGWIDPSTLPADDDDDVDSTEPPSPHQQFLSWQSRFVALLDQAVAEAESVQRGNGEPADEFNGYGFADAGDLKAKIATLQELVFYGATIAENRY